MQVFANAPLNLSNNDPSISRASLIFMGLPVIRLLVGNCLLGAKVAKYSHSVMAEACCKSLLVERWQSRDLRIDLDSIWSRFGINVSICSPCLLAIALCLHQVECFADVFWTHWFFRLCLSRFSFLCWSGALLDAGFDEPIEQRCLSFANGYS